MKWIKDRAVSLLAYIVSFVVVMFVVKYGIEYFSKDTLEDALKAQAVEIRKTLPIKYPNGITYVAVEAQGKKFTFFYELPNNVDLIEKTDLEIWKKEKKKGVVASLCKNTDFLKDIGRGAVYKFVYSTKDKAPVLSFSVAEEACSWAEGKWKIEEMDDEPTTGSSDITVRDEIIISVIGIPLIFGLAHLCGYLEGVDKSGWVWVLSFIGFIFSGVITITTVSSLGWKLLLSTRIISRKGEVLEWIVKTIIHICIAGVVASLTSEIMGGPINREIVFFILGGSVVYMFLTRNRWLTWWKRSFEKD